jgi:hypothetical protein
MAEAGIVALIDGIQPWSEQGSEMLVSPGSILFSQM